MLLPLTSVVHECYKKSTFAIESGLLEASGGSLPNVRTLADKLLVITFITLKRASLAIT